MVRKSLYPIKKEAKRADQDRQDRLVRTVAIIIAFIGVFVFFFKIVFF